MDLYFAGVSRPEGLEYILDHNLNALRSQLNDRTEIDKIISNTEYKGKLFIDSGAFSAHTKNKHVDATDYVNYCNANIDKFDVIAQLDTIPGEYRKKKTLKQLQEAPEKSWENFLYMREHISQCDKVLPIFHQSEDFYHLSRMLEWTDENGNHIPYIGISPANDLPTSKKIPWISQCFWIIKNSSNPNVKTHAFGMTALDVLESFPFYSADSTSYLMKAIFGAVMTPYGDVKLTEDMINPQSSLILDVKKYIESIGEDWEKCVSAKPYGTNARLMVNIKYMEEWANNYEYKGGNKFTKPLFFTKYKK